jgi:ribosomal protein S18 acetylase RimI-like enzyme
MDELTKLRDAGHGDEPFLRKMMYEAAAWNPDWPHEEVIEALSNPILARYIDGWRRPGDAGVIAERAGEAVGAAWYRLFTADAPGYGFVDERTPELGLAVVPLYRRHGVGTALLDALIDRAREDGYPALSLSVEPSNRSRLMYERAGFEKVGEFGGSWTMRLDLASRPSAPDSSAD